MQQCWKLATLEKFVCLNTHSLALQNTCTSTSPTHVAVLRTVSFSPPVTLLLFSLALEWLYCPLLLLKHCLQIAQVLPYQLKRKQWDIKKRACNAGIRWIARQWISSATRSTCTCKYVRINIRLQTVLPWLVLHTLLLFHYAYYQFTGSKFTLSW